MQNRRDFLKLLGMAIGASLSGCGGSSETFGGPVGSLPITYQFVPLVSSGQTLGRGRSFLGQGTASDPPAFPGGVMLNNQGKVAFHALDNSEVRGIYSLEVQSSGAASDIRTIVREGDVLPDGTVVEDFSDGEMNNSGDFVLQVENPEGHNSLQYCPDGGNFQKLVEAYQEVSETVKLSGEVCECQALSDDGHALFVAEYLNENGDAVGEGLFSLPVGQVSEAQLVLANNQLLPGTSSSIQTIGDSLLGVGGRYLVQGSASPTEGGRSSTSDGSPLTYLLTGRVGEAPQLLAAALELGANSSDVVEGSVFMCPRMSGDNVAYILQTDVDATELRLNQDLLLRANSQGGGDLSPNGSRIISMFPPVFGPSGSFLMQLFTVDGVEVVAYDGVGFRTVLARGDRINGKVVEDIMFGALPEGVNSRGEFVSSVVFSDGETVVLLGIPV